MVISTFGGCSLSVGMLAVVEKVAGGWCGGEGGWWLAWWRRWLVVGVVEKGVGGCRGGWSKITIAKEKHYLKDHSPGDTKNSL